jgi:hypothetical protein
MGQSLHWMDRDAVLRRLAEAVEDGGGLALVGPGRRLPQESWEPEADRVIAHFLGPRRPNRLRNPEPGHEPALRRSSHFQAFEIHEFEAEITRDFASVLGSVYSLSYAARPRYGDDAPAFEAALADALMALNPSGVFHERVETEVIVALRTPPP